MKRFTFAVKKGFFRTPSLPPRFEAKIASVCVVAALVVVANHFCYGPFTVFPQSHHNEPFMPADRTCSGGAYTFQIPGSLAAQDNVAIPMNIQNAASIACRHCRLLLVASTDRWDSPFLCSFSTSGYARSWTNDLHSDHGSTGAGAALWTFPGMVLRGQRAGTELKAGELAPVRVRFRCGHCALCTRRGLLVMAWTAWP